jgi:hypothetical protein
VYELIEGHRKPVAPQATALVTDCRADLQRALDISQCWFLDVGDVEDNIPFRGPNIRQVVGSDG